MRDVERAVEKLTEVHSELVGGTVAQSAPLITELYEARYPSIGRGGGGSGGGDLLNVKAVDLYEHIDGVVRARLAYFRQHSTGDLIPLTRQLFEVLKTEDAGGRLEDGERLFAMFPKWVAQIEDLFDPPREYELTADCPECETGHVASDAGELKWCVRVRVKPGRALLAECHACGKLWAGRESLTELAEQMGVEVDWVKLREVVNDTPG